MRTSQCREATLFSYRGWKRLYLMPLFSFLQLCNDSRLLFKGPPPAIEALITLYVTPLAGTDVARLKVQSPKDTTSSLSGHSGTEPDNKVRTTSAFKICQLIKKQSSAVLIISEVDLSSSSLRKKSYSQVFIVCIRQLTSKL